MARRVLHALSPARLARRLWPPLLFLAILVGLWELALAVDYVSEINDMPFAARFQPPLTTIHIPHYEIGKAAAQLMLERLQDADSQQREIRLEPSLVVRGSTAPPAAV